jgi:hypothetical protein
MNEMKRLILIAALSVGLTLQNASAIYNNNIAGQLDSFWSYADGDYIYFKLKNQPTTHPLCSPLYFVIPDTVPADRRKLMFARLSLAYAMRESVSIGYDSVGDCAHGYIRVHRVG